MLAAGGGIPRRALVRVQLRHGDRVAYPFVQLVGKRRVARLARRLLTAVRELFGALEDFDRECGHSHPPIVLTAFAAAATACRPGAARSAPRPGGTTHFQASGRVAGRVRQLWANRSTPVRPGHTRPPRATRASSLFGNRGAPERG